MRIALAIAAIAATATAAAADDKPAAGKSVLIIPFTGDGNDSERLQLSLAAIRGVRAAGATVELAQTSADDLIAINGCTATDADCLARIPATLGVDAIVFGKVSNADGKQTVVLVRVEAASRDRNRGEASAVETQAGVLFGLPPAAGTDKPDDSGGKTGGGGVEGGYTGDLGGGSGALDGRGGGGEEAGPNYGRRDGQGLDFSQVERYSWGLTIGGGAAVAVGGLFLLFGNVTQGSIDDAPTETADDLDDLEGLESRARAFYGIGNTLAIAGLITASVGGVLVLYQASRDRPETATEPGPAIGLTPLRGGGAMLTVGVRR